MKLAPLGLIPIASWLFTPSIVAVREQNHVRRNDNNNESRRAKKQPQSGPGGPKQQKVEAVVVGGGIAGHTAMWEMAKHGVGSSNGGIMLIEKSPSDSHVCGIIESVTFPEESSGLNLSPFDANYRPYRTTTHAMRINIGTQNQMRCLAHELKIPMYFTPWMSESRYNGYIARSGGFGVAPNASITSAKSARSACRAGNRNVLYESNANCTTNYGYADLVKQTSSTGIAAVNLWNYNPKLNYNQGANDPVDEFLSWALGYPNYYNPTANYDGKGSTYNNASPYPFQPNNPSQDHPRHQCRFFKDVYSLYQYYVGPDYAYFVCQSNAGFSGRCYVAADPCSYLASSTEEGLTFTSNLRYDEGYPVGSMTELCTRQKWLAEHNTNGVATAYIKGEAVTSIDFNKASDKKKFGKYAVKTSAGRTVFTNAVVIAAEPPALEKMSGSVIKKIVSQPQFQVTNPFTDITVTFHWKSHSPGWDWSDAVSKTLIGSYRMFNPGSCLNRIDIPNTPYHRNGDSRYIRAVYTDNVCIHNLEGLAALDDPTGKLNFDATTGFPVNGALASEVLRELREIFTGGGPYSFYNISNIPPPDLVVYDYQPYSVFYFKSGTTYKIKEIANWATQPLGPNEKVILAHQAWQIQWAGWAQTSVNITREGMLKLFPDKISRANYDTRNACNPKWPKEDYTITYQNKCDPTKLPTKQVCDPATKYSAPGVEKQWEYANGLPNEHFPPYSWSEPIVWQA